eukprot:478713-Pleurochrysis_carterae.AAC.1
MHCRTKARQLVAVRLAFTWLRTPEAYILARGTITIPYHTWPEFGSRVIFLTRAPTAHGAHLDSIIYKLPIYSYHHLLSAWRLVIPALVAV